jgi:hypothetical protein
MLEREVNELNRTFMTDYWFDDDDDDNDEKYITDILNNYQWESIPQSKRNYFIIIFFKFLFK